VWGNSDLLDNVFNGKFAEVELGNFKVPPSGLLSSVASFIAKKKSEESHQPDVSSMKWSRMRRDYLEEVLRKSGGNKTKAADLAGVPKSTFRDWLNKEHIKP
jgi:DNA-binding protein Fis